MFLSRNEQKAAFYCFSRLRYRAIIYSRAIKVRVLAWGPGWRGRFWGSEREQFHRNRDTDRRVLPLRGPRSPSSCCHHLKRKRELLMTPYVKHDVIQETDFQCQFIRHSGTVECGGSQSAGGLGSRIDYRAAPGSASWDGGGERKLGPGWMSAEVGAWESFAGLPFTAAPSTLGWTSTETGPPEFITPVWFIARLTVLTCPTSHRRHERQSAVTSAPAVLMISPGARRLRTARVDAQWREARPGVEIDGMRLTPRSRRIA
jgi:hypothetical protein